jgi:hypothetical protein
MTEEDLRVDTNPGWRCPAARVVSQATASLSTASWRLYVLRPGVTDSCWTTSDTRTMNASFRRFSQTRRWPLEPTH